MPRIAALLPVLIALVAGPALAGAPVATRDAPYPVYQVGDLATLTVTTDPPQAGAPVYRFRYRNGQPDGEQGAYIGDTDGDGVLFREAVLPAAVVGHYTYERFAVGSPTNPKSSSLSYWVHAAAAPTTERPAPYPSYTVGDLAIHRITTAPAQGGQPVYRSRRYNGTVQDDLIGHTDGTGTLEIALPVAPEVVGHYTGERVSVGTAGGPRSAPRAYHVHAAAAPAASRAAPYPGYQVGQTATLSIVTDPVQARQPVYRFRLRDGQPDGEQPTWIGTTGDDGRLEVGLPLGTGQVGSYSQERFAVGTAGGPTSLPMLAYTVAGGGGGSSGPNPPLAVRPAPYPSYQVGDQAVLVLTTDPPQPGQAVYRFRLRNGQHDGAQPTAIGTTDAQGRLALSLPLTAAQVGLYSDERFAIGDPAGPTSAPLAYTVAPDPATLVAPSAFRPQPFPNYRVGDTARLLIATDPPQPGQPVYRYRLHDNQLDGEQPTWIGTTGADGTLAISAGLGEAAVGLYSAERFAVGSPTGPASPPMFYSVWPQDLELAPPSASRDAPFPTYTSYDTATLRVSTDPAQPYQPVYRFRRRDGQPDGAQPTYLGMTNGAGELVLQAQVPPEAAGSYSDERFAIGAPDGPTSPPLAYTVVADGSTPSLRFESVTPTEVAAGAVTGMTLHGAGFLPGDQVTVAARGGQPVPAVTVLAVSTNGTEIEIDLDAGAFDDEDFLLLSVERGAQHRAQPFRLLPPGPIVDAWTPSVPARGEAYVFTVLGSNLADAAIYPEHPERVTLDILSQSANRVLGLLRIEADAQLGFTNIVFDDQGRSARVPLDLVPADSGGGGGDGEGWGEGPNEAKGRSVASVDLLKDSELSRQAIAAGLPVPRLLVQGIELSSRMSQKAAVDIGSTDDWCFQFNFSATWTYHYPILMKTFTINLDTGEIGRILAILDPDNPLLAVLNAGVFAISITADVVIHFEFGWHSLSGWSKPILCIEVSIAAEVPGGAGSASFRGCATASGITTNHSAGHTFAAGFDGGPCASVDNVEVNEGFGISTITQEACCDQQLDAHVEGITFGQTFAIEEPNVGETQATGCARAYHIEMRSFIPVNYVTVDGIINVCFYEDPNGPIQVREYLYQGDDRNFTASPTASHPQEGYRMQQQVTVFADASQCSSCTPQGELIGSRVDLNGVSSRFAEDALVTPSPGRITPADRDGVPNDCKLWDQDVRAVADDWSVSVASGGPKEVWVTLSASQNDIQVQNSPEIDWFATIVISEDYDPPRFSLTVKHDCYPAYEIYINDQHIYGYMPTTHSFLRLLSCLPAPMNIQNICSGRLDGSPVQCVMQD